MSLIVPVSTSEAHRMIVEATRKKKLPANLTYESFEKWKRDVGISNLTLHDIYDVRRRYSDI